MIKEEYPVSITTASTSTHQLNHHILTINKRLNCKANKTFCCFGALVPWQRRSLSSIALKRHLKSGKCKPVKPKASGTLRIYIYIYVILGCRPKVKGQISMQTADK